MDILSDLLGTARTCACGMTHRCEIATVRMGAGVLDTLGAMTAAYRRILLVADTHTYAACGETVMAQLTGRGQTVNTLIYPGEPVLVPDDAALARLEAAIGGDTQLVLGVGAGVINDLCKCASFRKDLPYMIVATAPSMDGYASAGAALLLNGMKVTLQTHTPAAILADTRILREAPLPLIRAGYGDMIGKYSSLNDWKLSHQLTDEPFCPFIHDLVAGQVRQIVQLAEGLERRDEAAIAALMEGLLTVGVAMGLMNNSRPASGSEHHLAHFYEVNGLLRGTPYFPHGVNVAYATVITCALRHRLAAAPFPPAPPLFDRRAWEQQTRRVFGPLAPRVVALQTDAGLYTQDRGARLRRQEAVVKQLLRETPTAADMQELLVKVSLNWADFTALYKEQTLHDSLVYAKDLKTRYTVLWLLQDLGYLHTWADTMTFCGNEN